MGKNNNELSKSQLRFQKEREKQAEERREEILNAALKLFLNKGIMGVTFNDLCKETTLSRATLYRYYESLEHIAYELAGKIYNTQIDRVSTKILDINVDSIRSIIYYFIDHFNEIKDELAYQAMFDHYFPLSSTDKTLEDNYFKQVTNHFGQTKLVNPTHIKLSIVFTMARSYLERLAKPGDRPERESYMDIPNQLDYLKEIVDRELNYIESNF